MILKLYKDKNSFTTTHLVAISDEERHTVLLQCVYLVKTLVKTGPLWILCTVTQINLQKCLNDHALLTTTKTIYMDFIESPLFMSHQLPPTSVYQKQNSPCPKTDTITVPATQRKHPNQGAVHKLYPYPLINRRQSLISPYSRLKPEPMPIQTGT